MTGFDYALLTLLGLSVLLGFWRGLVVEVFALFAWVLAVLAARLFAGSVAGLLSPWLSAPWLQLAAAAILIVVAVLIVLALIRMLLRELLAAVGLSLADRCLGACFGAVRALVLAVLIVGAAGLTSLPREPWWREARFAAPLETLVLAVRPWLPPELAGRIKYR